MRHPDSPILSPVLILVALVCGGNRSPSAAPRVRGGAIEAIEATAWFAKNDANKKPSKA